MTDKYGSDADHHDKAGEHEHAMTGENETWTGEPPVDDFHAGEEAAIVSEETEDAEVNGEGSVVAETHKKSLALPIIAGIGGLLFLGAVLYWQFNNNAANTPIAAIPPLSNQAPPLVSEIERPAPATSSPMTTDVAPTTALESPSAPPAVPAVVLPPKPPADAALPPMPSTAPVAPSPVATPAAATPTPMAASVPALAPSSTLASAPPVVGNGSIDTRLSVLSAHVDDLQKALMQATQQLSQVSAKLAANAPSSPSGDSEIDDRLNKIEQKLMQIQHGASSRSVAVMDSAPDVAPEKTDVRKHAHKTVVKKASFVKVKKAPHKSLAPQKEKPTFYSNWVLRAATPDEAWIATDASSPELRHVQVGDTLSGVGKVQAIRQNGDNWVIEGTNGTIQ